MPLDVAASEGRAQIVLELVRRLGVEGCGGASRVDALILWPCWSSMLMSWRCWSTLEWWIQAKL